MSKFDSKHIMPRYSLVAVALSVVAVAVIAKALYVMTVKREYWMEVADRVKKDSVIVTPMRGNILSCDGQLLASSLPEYKIYFDFEQIHQAGNDSLWDAKLDSLCLGLHTIFPDKTAQQFKSDLTKGFNTRVKSGSHKGEKTRYWPIWPKRIDYNTYTEVLRLPFLNQPSNLSGLGKEEIAARESPYGTLAHRTLGDTYKEKDGGRTPRFGLELSYDSLLRGTNGIVHRRKVLNHFLNITDTPPVNGYDIITTIDVGMQDLAERAVIEKLREIDGNVGVAIVMEVKTGDVKAIVNMERCSDGQYRELQNHAVSDLMEPGSVFKTASVMTALEDGVCDTSLVCPTGNGVWEVYGRQMKDSHWRSGGYGNISLGRAFELSSNIGISYMADKFYHNDPQKFVRGIWRTGINDPNIKIPIPGHAVPKIRMPKKAPNGQWLNWSKTALLWMSIGYETQIPPIYTLTFYNAIANNGTMMQPRFVKGVIKDDGTTEEFEPVVVKGREHIASEKTIKIMQDLLHRVVVNGTGKKANSSDFWVCGKTGTAMISKNGVYGGANHLLSFAGWFGKQDQPYYSCIVCIQKTGLPAYGWMSGEVFKQIAEGVMSKYVRYYAADAADGAPAMPNVKGGDILSADYVLRTLGIKTDANFKTVTPDGAPVWGMALTRSNGVYLKQAPAAGKGTMPDLRGMGARDAVYMAESRGLTCLVQGRGKVTRQSIAPGETIRKGQICTITLE